MSQDMSRYLGLFVSEATEHLERLGQALVGLEKAPPEQLPAAVDGLFRHAHSLKGMAASMGYEPATQLAHGAEDLLDALRAQPSRLGGEVVDLLLGAVDALSSQVRCAEAGR
ncbi:MAG: Hpt domain-containing protein, partial [Deltaproteobacteria bacterium]|nr:Hpt domain-containing protein [Deltaproteobacteria bacterium]